MVDHWRRRVRVWMTALGLRELFGDLAILANARVLGMALSFAVSLLLARMLGPAGLGVYAFTTSVLMILQPLAGGGLGTLATRDLADRELSAVHGRALAGRLIGVSLYLAFAVSALVVVGVYFTGAQNAGALYLLALVLPTAVVMETMGGILSGQQKVKASVTLTNPVKLAILLLFLAVIWAIGAGRAEPAVALVALAAATAVVILLLYRVSPLKPGLAEILKPSRHGLVRVFKLSLPFALVAALQYLQRRIDIVLLGVLLDDVAVGQYQVAGRIADLCGLPAALVSALAAPRFSAQISAGTRKDLRLLFWRGIALALPAGLALLGVILAFALPILSITFGEPYLPAAQPLYVLAVWTSLAVFRSLPGMLLMMAGYERRMALVVGASAALNGLGNWVLIPVYGTVGAAISTAVVGLLTAVVFFVLVYRLRLLGDGRSGS